MSVQTRVKTYEKIGKKWASRTDIPFPLERDAIIYIDALIAQKRPYPLRIEIYTEHNHMEDE